MAKAKVEKRKTKRKAKLKQRRHKETRSLQREKADYLFHEALWFCDQGEFEKSLVRLKNAIRLDPVNKNYLEQMAYIGHRMRRSDVEIKGLLGLYEQGRLEDDLMPTLCDLMYRQGRDEEALNLAEETLSHLPKLNIKNKREVRGFLVQVQDLCSRQLERKRLQENIESQKDMPEPVSKLISTNVQVFKSKPKKTPIEKRKLSFPEIPITIEIDTQAFKTALAPQPISSLERYELSFQAYQIRLKETFDHLICLSSLQEVRSLWYQEETARKVLKQFRGRALLADEVGLGKTIEALMVFKEYVQRGMVKSALILTLAPLVSQWQEELKVKFGVDVTSTDDPDYRTIGDGIWKVPFVVSSINIAKSKKNFPLVIEREYDLVIVDEAHHLKNRNTLNWKLVNSLKKRFLLLLTATPVENNLMELYNLITLLKPGQLKTATTFRKEFMTRGDPADPQNRAKLKDLLGEVMIRNTRALAKVDIPTRFAQTIKLDPTENEKELYERITTLIKDINQTNGTGHRLLLKNLLAEAGSSPRAVSLTLTRMFANKELLLKHEKEFRAINNLCRTMDDNRKNRFLLNLIKSTPGKKIIFVKYLGTVEYLSDFLSWEGIPHALFHGGLNNQKKDEQIKHFREYKDILVTTEVGGEGRNLQFCHQMVNYDLPWNPMKIEQRIGRIHRIGQEKEVMIYNLCAANSVEDYILEVLDKKINMFEMVIGEIDMILGRIKGEQEFSEIVFDIWLNTSSEAEKTKSFDQLANRLKRMKNSYKKTKALDEKLFGENYEL